VADNKRTFDVIIVGAGVVGSLCARELARYQLDILLLDKCSDVGEGTTKANTAIVHAGYDAKPGSLKATLNVAGNALYDEVCAELDVDFDRCGTYVVGLADGDESTLQALLARGLENGVPALEIISGEEMRRREPALTSDARAALYAPSGGLVDPFQLCYAAAENAVANGVELRLNTEVTGLWRNDERIVGVLTPAGPIRGRYVVIAAGLWADTLMHQAGLDSFAIRPRKGEYFVMDKAAADVVRNVLFPCPTSVSKGILVTRTIHGNVMLGPNAVEQDDKCDLSTSQAGLNEVMEGALKLVPGLDSRHVIRTFAGLRAGGNTGDFYIDAPRSTPGLVVLAGIESPGLTAAPSIARYVTALLGESGLCLEPRPAFSPIRHGIPRFSELDDAEREALIAQDPRWGRIICRCEMVSEAEIVAACHAPVPARTYDALKRRVRVGSGRCQGGFDQPYVIDIMARELGVSPLEITKKGRRSQMVVRRTKELRA